MPEHTKPDENLCAARWTGDNVSSRAVNSGKDAHKTKQSLAGLQRCTFFPWLRLEAANIYRLLSPRLMLWYSRDACVHKCMHAPGGGGCQALPLTSDKVKMTSVYSILENPSTPTARS